MSFSKHFLMSSLFLLGLYNFSRAVFSPWCEESESYTIKEPSGWGLGNYTVELSQ